MNKAILAVATDNGVSVLKPGQQATDYVLAGRGLVGRKCGSITRTGDQKIAVGTQDFFVQLSADGSDWKASFEGISRPHITSLGLHPKHKHLLFAGSSPPAVYMSADYGKSWTTMAPLESLPSADRWSYPEAPYRARVSSIVCHGAHPGVIFCSIENGGIAASKDGGKSWSTRGTGLPPSVRQLSFSDRHPDRVYAATGTGFFYSADLGSSWQERNQGLPFTRVEAMAIAEQNPDIVLLSVATGPKGPSTVVLSKDAGQSWSVANVGLPDLDSRRVSGLTFGVGGFYASTDRGEIFFLNNLEGRWIQVATGLGTVRAITALA